MRRSSLKFLRKRRENLRLLRSSQRSLCLDKGYDYPRVEDEVQMLGYTPHIKRRGIQEEDTLLSDGRRYPARRWVVERTFAWLKAFRAVRTRYTRKLANYLALVYFACALRIFQRAVA